MSVRKLKPITPAQRFTIVNGFDAITKSRPEKSLLAPKKRTGGRNNSGKMTVKNLGGGHKKRYRIIDFKRDKFNIEAEVISIEYDPNRTAFIAFETKKVYLLFISLSLVAFSVIIGLIKIFIEIRLYLKFFQSN